MALVILPCDLPHWYSLQKELTSLSAATTPKQLVDGMLKIHNMCMYVWKFWGNFSVVSVWRMNFYVNFSTSTGLDPDEPEKTDPTIFHKLENFITELSPEEQTHFFSKTLRIMAKRALDLKKLKPANGFHFSLQQQGNYWISSKQRQVSAHCLVNFQLTRWSIGDHSSQVSCRILSSQRFQKGR